MNFRWLIVSLLAVCLAAFVSVAHGADSVWSGIVFASNAAAASSPVPEIARLHGKLKDIFGYNQFDLLSHHLEKMDEPVERWMLPTKKFSIRVTSAKKADPGYLLHLQVYQGKELRAETEARLGMESPVFIRGPLCGKGQLIVILTVR